MFLVIWSFKWEWNFPAELGFRMTLKGSWCPFQSLIIYSQKRAHTRVQAVPRDLHQLPTVHMWVVVVIVVVISITNNISDTGSVLFITLTNLDYYKESGATAYPFIERIKAVGVNSEWQASRVSDSDEQWGGYRAVPPILPYLWSLYHPIIKAQPAKSNIVHSEPSILVGSSRIVLITGLRKGRRFVMVKSYLQRTWTSCWSRCSTTLPTARRTCPVWVMHEYRKAKLAKDKNHEGESNHRLSEWHVYTLISRLEEHLPACTLIGEWERERARERAAYC